MKNYFELYDEIIPFNSIYSIIKIKDPSYIDTVAKFFYGDGKNFYYLTQKMFDEYMLWLDAQSNHSEIPTSCSCSEKDTSRDVVLTRMQAKSVLSVLESIAIQKNTALEDAYNVLKDRLGSVAKLYQSQFTCSEKANDSNNPKNQALQMIKEMQVTKQSNGTEIPQVKWLIECWEAVYGRKFEKLTDDDTTAEFLENFLHDCLGILDYAGALNNINKGDLGNHFPDVGKMVLTREQVIKIIERIDCKICERYKRNYDCQICYRYDNMIPTDDFVKKINELINEV